MGDPGPAFPWQYTVYTVNGNLFHLAQVILELLCRTEVFECGTGTMPSLLLGKQRTSYEYQRLYNHDSLQFYPRIYAHDAS
jgi:hypothetical protein